MNKTELANQRSLILGDGAQLPLLEVDDAGIPAAIFSDSEAVGRWTGERLFLGNPKLYRVIVALLGRGLPYREIADICSVSVNTVCGVAHRERIPVETIRERIAALGLDVAQLTIEALRDLLSDPEMRSKISVRDLSIAFGIAVEKTQLLTGAATQRIETVERAEPSHDDYLKFLKTAIPVPTGSEPETPRTKELPPSAQEPVIEISPTPSADANDHPAK